MEKKRQLLYTARVDGGCNVLFVAVIMLFVSSYWGTVLHNSK